MSKIELREATGHRAISRGRWVKVTLPRKDIFYEGVLVARIGNKPNSRLQMVANLGEDITATLTSEVERILQRENMQINNPPQPVDIDDDDLEEEDEDS